MKICILGLDSATPQLIFSDERLANVRRLRELGVYGELQSTVPPGAVPGWICLATSQDPGSLGIYGLRNRPDCSYSPPVPAASTGVQAALWDQVAAAGKKSIVVAVPPIFLPRRIAGISIGCSLTSDPAVDEITFPEGLRDAIRELMGDYAADVNLAGQSQDELRERIFDMNRKHWEAVRWLLREQEWDYFHFVDAGLDRVQRAFWRYFDPQHPQYQPGNPYQEVISDYHLWLDEQVGSVLELLDAETVLLLVSTNGARALDGGFAINQWLQREGLLVLNEPPGPGITPFDQFNINWTRTRAWGGGGPCASLYFNVQGREPQGVIPAQDYEAFRDELKTRLESLCEDGGRPLQAQGFKPNRLYRQTRNVAPDLIVQFNEGRCSAIGSVGHPGLFVRDLADGCTPATPGIFVLNAPNCPLNGAYEGAHLLDMAPTVLDLAGYEIPASTQGRSLVAGMEKRRGDAGPDSDQIILDRLAGLGYV